MVADFGYKYKSELDPGLKEVTVDNCLGQWAGEETRLKNLEF